MQPVLVRTELGLLFYGYIKDRNQHPLNLWHSATVLFSPRESLLASSGPGEYCWVGLQEEMIKINNVKSVIDVSEEAEKAWKEYLDARR
jgi:hypothetical protein